MTVAETKDATIVGTIAEETGDYIIIDDCMDYIKV